MRFARYRAYMAGSLELGASSAVWCGRHEVSRRHGSLEMWMPLRYWSLSTTWTSQPCIRPIMSMHVHSEMS